VDFFDGSWVQHILANYGYAAIFIVVMLESAGVPLPGETILVSAAAFAGNKHSLDIRYVIAAAAGGAIFGDNIGSGSAGNLVRRCFRDGISDRARRTEEEAGQYLFARHGGKIVFFGRFVALLRAFAALLAGANGLSPCVPHLQCGGGNCLGDSVRSWRIRAWRRYSSNRWTIWMGGAYCSDRFGRPSLALLQEK